MEIQPNLNAGKVNPLPAEPAQVRRIEPTTDQAAFSGAAALEAAMQRLPEVRTDRVRDAAQLIGDPSYPPEQTMKRLANLLAMTWPPYEA